MERWLARPYSSRGAGSGVVLRHCAAAAACACLTVDAANMVFSERELKFMFAICHRRSVCRLSSVVCDVRAPYSDD